MGGMVFGEVAAAGAAGATAGATAMRPATATSTRPETSRMVRMFCVRADSRSPMMLMADSSTTVNAA